MTSVRSVSATNLEDKTLHRTGSRYKRKDRAVRGGDTVSSRFLATINKERRRCSDPSVGGVVVQSPDSSPGPVDGTHRRVLLLAPPTAAEGEAASGGYHSDSAAVLSGKEKYGGNAKPVTFERSESRISKPSLDIPPPTASSSGARPRTSPETPSPTSSARPRTPTFVIHRSLSVLSTTSRSSSYEEELEERVGNIQVGAQLWQQRAAMERRKRLDLVEQMKAQERSFRTMMENMREQGEQKYERLKNRARLLMKRCEKLRGDRQLLEAKLAQLTDTSTRERQEQELQIAELTKEINRLTDENEVKISTAANVGMRNDLGISDCISTTASDGIKNGLGINNNVCKNENIWCSHYEALLNIAVKRIRTLERCILDVTERMAASTEVVEPDRDKRFINGLCLSYPMSTSCPTLLPSVVDSRTFQQSKDVDERIINTSSKTLLSNEKRNKNSKPDGHWFLLSSDRHFNTNNQFLSKDSEVRIRQQYTKLQRVESPKKLRIAQRPVSDIFPVLQEQVRSSKPANGILKDIDSSYFPTGLKNTSVSRSSTFLASPAEDSFTDVGFSPKQPNFTRTHDVSPTQMTRVKPRRVVSMPRIDLFRRFGRHYSNVKERPPAFSQSTSNGGVISRANGRSIETVTNVDNDEFEEDQISTRSTDSKGEDCNYMSASTGSLMSLPSDGDFNCSRMTSRVRFPLQEQSSFSRLRERRNGLTDSNDVRLRAAVSRSKLDQIAKNIKTYLH